MKVTHVLKSILLGEKKLFIIWKEEGIVTETISRTDEGQPRPKYIFNKCGPNIYFFLLYRGLVHHHRILKKKISCFAFPPFINTI